MEVKYNFWMEYNLTLNPLTWKIWWTNNASRWQMGFNSALKGLKTRRRSDKCKTHEVKPKGGGGEDWSLISKAEFWEFQIIQKLFVTTVQKHPPPHSGPWTTWYVYWLHLFEGPAAFVLRNTPPPPTPRSVLYDFHVCVICHWILRLMRVNIFGMERTPHLLENLAGHYSTSLILLLLISEPTPLLSQLPSCVTLTFFT